MEDLGHVQTDKLLESLEERLGDIYTQAYEDVKKKADDYFARFAVKDKAKRDLVAAGKMSKDEYSTWRRNQMLSGKRWTDLRDQLAQDLTNVNKIAAGMVRGELNEVFAINANYSEYIIENGMRMNYGFTLYDRNTVANLVMNDPDIIPWKPDVDVPADLRWNRQMVTSHITQGILQGESIPHLSKRLLKTVNNDRVAAVRTARTAVTSAQNAGRQAVYDKAKSMGLNLQKEWLATSDGRTRHDHGMADGQRVPLDGKFTVGGHKMKYPGDMSAPGWLVYNCRCTTITVEPPHITKGEEPRKTYNEWVEGKKKEKHNKPQGWESLPNNVTDRVTAIDKLLTEETGKKSVFNGKVVIEDSIKFNGTANYDGSITLRSNASIKTEIHELLHQHSEGGQNKVYVSIFKNIEEGSVELLAQEICHAKGIKIGQFDYSYTPYVDALRQINKLSGVYKTDYDFAMAVFGKPLEKRAEFLKSFGDSVAKDEKRFFRGALKTLGVK